MKVCHFSSAHPATDIRVFHKECVSLAKAGHEVYLVVANSEEKIVEGVHIVSVTSEATGRFSRMLKTAKAVYQKALSLDADVYHFHDPELLRFALKLKRKGKKVIYDAHEDLPKQIMGKYWINKSLRGLVAFSIQKYENYVCKRISGVITATPFIAERFVKVNKNTLDINNFPKLNELANDSPWSEKGNYACYIGGISEIRGLSQVIDAFELQEGLKLKLAGPITSGSNSYGEKLQAKKGWSSVEYLGIINRSEVKEVMSSSKVGIVTFLPLPNHIDAQPNKMFEYMSAGIPVIGSFFPLWKEILEKNNCGLCINPESPDEIAKALKTLTEDDALAEEMGRNGRKAVLEIYNWEKEKDKLLSFYALLNNN